MNRIEDIEQACKWDMPGHDWINDVRYLLGEFKDLSRKLKEANSFNEKLRIKLKKDDQTIFDLCEQCDQKDGEIKNLEEQLKGAHQKIREYIKDSEDLPTNLPTNIGR